VRVVFVNRYVHPDHSATSQILSDLAGALAAAGVEVVLVGSRQAYDDPLADLPAQSTWSGVVIRRLAGTRFGRARLVGRALDYLSFYAAVFFALLGLLRRGDVVVAKTDPPLVSLVVGLAARLRGARLVNWLQDVFPEVAVALGEPRLPGWFARGLVALRDVSLRMAMANVAIGERMAVRVRGGAGRSRVVVIPNWAHEPAVRPLDAFESALRRELGLVDRFVVAYSGNLGRAHDGGTIFDAAVALQGRADIAFVVIGGGHEYVRLRERVAAAGLGNVRFLPYQPYERLADSMAAADVHLVSLRTELEGLIVPSKFFGVLAAARPVVFIGAADGELARVIDAGQCGTVVRQGDGAGLAANLVGLAADRARCVAMGQAGLALLRERYAREAAHAAWLGLLRDVAG
jgi:glycosyltransferase involved in cell wall biosynthesis